MAKARPLPLSLLALAAFSAGVTTLVHPRRSDGSATLCRMMPGGAIVLLRVERDTTLPISPVQANVMSYSSVPSSASDSLLASTGTPMPAALVRLLQVDSATRQVFLGAGLTDEQPFAFIRAEPYRADCRTIRWTDSVPWVQRGDTGYARATLAPRQDWIGGVPLLVIRDVWNFPYPRQRGLAYGTFSRAPLAPADALYSLNVTLNVADRPAAPDATHRVRALAWARAHPRATELEPVRSLVRDAVLHVDWQEVQRIPSRLRGTYRVTMEGNGARGTWYFRTHDRPGYTWRDADTVRTTADLLASPHVSGYQLVGYAAGTRDALLGASPDEMRNVPLVWLAAADRPTTPGNDSRRILAGSLEFKLFAAPASLWGQLEAFIPPLSAEDSAMWAQIDLKIGPRERQARLPITLRIDDGGNPRADTNFTIGGRRLLVSVARIDTVSVRRPF